MFFFTKQNQRQFSCIGIPYLNVTRRSPEFTEAPFVTATVSTVASLGAAISFSIFIASSMSRVSPALKACPGLTFTSRMVHGIGAVRSPAPPAAGAAAAGAAGAGAGAGAAAGAAAGAGAAAAGAAGAGAGAGALPASSTSTAYVVPLTVILYFFILSSSFR